MPRLSLRRSFPLGLVAALLLGLTLTVGPVAAATPTVTANPPLVPFSEAPGLPGATQLTFAANGTAGLSACGQDNGNAPFRLGSVDPSTPLVVNFPYIQAGTYPFWLSADSGCGGASKLATATATRVGPTGKAGQDDIGIRFSGFSSTAAAVAGTEVVLDGTVFSNPPKVQAFPIPNARICIMSGDGAQVSIKVQYGQDPRPQGLGNAAVTSTVVPIVGQNGCYTIPWVLNGAYVASIARSGVAASLGFCAATAVPGNAPSNPPTAAGIGKCAQVNFFPSADSGPFPPGTTLVNGSIVTGADNHAVQVCVAAFAPNPNPAGAPFLELANTVNAYSANGATDLTPLDIGFPPKTVVKISTYDIAGPGPGGAGGAQFVCPAATAIQSGNVVTAIIVPDVPGATIIDTKNYFRS